MIRHEIAISLLILFVNVFIILLYAYNLILRLHKCTNSDNRTELNYHFKLVMISLISILISAGMFYVSLKLMYKLVELPPNFLMMERLLISIGMAARAVFILTIDKHYNPFHTKT